MASVAPFAEYSANAFVARLASVAVACVPPPHAWRTLPVAWSFTPQFAVWFTPLMVAEIMHGLRRVLSTVEGMTSSSEFIAAAAPLLTTVSVYVYVFGSAAAMNSLELVMPSTVDN